MKSTAAISVLLLHLIVAQMGHTKVLASCPLHHLSRQCDFTGYLSTLVPVDNDWQHKHRPACCKIERDLLFHPDQGSEDSTPDAYGLSDFVTSFGQFSLAHDNALTREDKSRKIFETCGSDFTCSLSANTVAADTDNELENAVTSCTDASNLYGSGRDGRLLKIVDMNTGFMRVDENILPPKGVCKMDKEKRSPKSMFCLGDVRGNENTQLLAHHLLWIREHNWQAKRLKSIHPDWKGDTVFAKAREIVIAEMQKVMAYELLDSLLGPNNALKLFDRECSAKPTGKVLLFKEFSQAIWRVPHSMVNNNIDFRDSQGAIRTRGMDSTYFVPESISNGLESTLNGMFHRPALSVDFVYPSGLIISKSALASNVHLGARDCLRGRRSSLASYAQVRRHFGLAAVSSWNDISSSVEKQQKLEKVYGGGNWRNVDLLVGALAEDHLPHSSVGAVVAAVTHSQLHQIRCNDPNWFERVLKPHEINKISSTTYADIILRNTSPQLLPKVPKNPFKVPSATNPFITREHWYQKPH